MLQAGRSHNATGSRWRSTRAPPCCTPTTSSTSAASSRWHATFLTGAGFLLHTASIGLRSMRDARHAARGPELARARGVGARARVLRRRARREAEGVRHGARAGLGAAARRSPSSSASTRRHGRARRRRRCSSSTNWRVGHPRGAHHVRQRRASPSARRRPASTWCRRRSSSSTGRTRCSGGCRRSRRPTRSRGARSPSRIPVYTAGLLLGVMRAIETAPPAGGSTRASCSPGIVWAIFGVYLFLRYQRGMTRPQRRVARARRASLFVIVAGHRRRAPSRPASTSSASA